MAIVLLIKPAGLFGRRALAMTTGNRRSRRDPPGRQPLACSWHDGVMAALLAVAPFVGIYPVFLMKALCFALFACAFNLLLGFGGLLSFGHAMFLGTAGYVARARGQGAGACRRSSRSCSAPLRVGGCSAWSSARWRSAGRASTSR